MRLNHHQARQIITRLADDDQSGDRADDLAALLAYITGQEEADAMDSVSAGRVAHAADRRSCEAVARCQTNASDIKALSEFLDEKIALVFGAMEEIVGLIAPSSEN